MRYLAIICLLAVATRLEAQNTSADKLLERAQHEHSSGNYQEALKAYDECLRAAPALLQAYIGRAATKTELKDLRGALTDYSIAIDRDALNFEAHLGRANVLYKLKRYEEARADYLQLLTLDPGETNTIYFQKSASPTSTMQITTAQSDIHPVIFNYLGVTETRLKNYSKAKAWLDSAIILRPKEADYFVNRGLVRQHLGDPNASDDFNRALKINPQHTAALSALAGSAKSGGETYLNEAIESDSTILQPYLERAYRRMQDADYAGALADYDHALTIDSSDPEIWLNRAYVKDKLNDLAGALTDLNMAIAAREDYAEAWLNRGNVLQKQGKFAEALEDYSVAITYDPDYAAAFYNRAIVKQRLNKITEACSDLQMAASLGMSVPENLRKAVCD